MNIYEKNFLEQQKNSDLLQIAKNQNVSGVNTKSKKNDFVEKILEEQLNKVQIVRNGMKIHNLETGTTVDYKSINKAKREMRRLVDKKTRHTGSHDFNFFS